MRRDGPPKATGAVRAIPLPGRWPVTAGDDGGRDPGRDGAADQATAGTGAPGGAGRDQAGVHLHHPPQTNGINESEDREAETTKRNPEKTGHLPEEVERMSPLLDEKWEGGCAW